MNVNSGTPLIADCFYFVLQIPIESRERNERNERSHSRSSIVRAIFHARTYESEIANKR